MRIRLKETDSTNRYLRELASKGQALTDDTEMCVVTAEYQTAGRGCGTNRWESERGQNLLFSLLCRPKGIVPSRQFRLSMMISVAMADVLSRYVDGVSVKWPNDIYVGDRKIAGILMECRIHGGELCDCLIGIGINVNQTMFHSDAPNPVSLRQLTGTEHDREQLLAEILDSFGALLDDGDAEGIAAKYKSLLYRRTGSWQYADSEGTFRAQLHDVTDEGMLVLLDEEGRERRYAFKEVSYVPACRCPHHP
jgi:BirA family biotin operon repressor/biotin-[acetyl-CoA-carboxylase] ligase